MGKIGESITRKMVCVTNFEPGLHLRFSILFLQRRPILGQLAVLVHARVRHWTSFFLIDTAMSLTVHWLIICSFQNYLLVLLIHAIFIFCLSIEAYFL